MNRPIDAAHPHPRIAPARPLAVAAAALLAALPSAGALAAGGPYVVDDTEVTPAGECKVDAWVGVADNGDRLAVASPACTFAALPMVEFTLQWTRAREEGEYGTTLGAKAKAALGGSEELGVAFGLIGGLDYDASEGRVGAVSLTVPVTFYPAEGLHLNVNLGWRGERNPGNDLVFWGAGADWAALPRLTVIGEVFGLSEGRPGFQAGLRPAIIEDVLELDLVYGRNVTGTRGNWFTLGATVHF